MEAPCWSGLAGGGGRRAPHTACEAQLHRLRLGVAGREEVGLRGEQVRARLELARVDREDERLRLLSLVQGRPALAVDADDHAVDLPALNLHLEGARDAARLAGKARLAGHDLLARNDALTEHGRRRVAGARVAPVRVL